MFKCFLRSGFLLGELFIRVSRVRAFALRPLVIPRATRVQTRINLKEQANAWPRQDEQGQCKRHDNHEAPTAQRAESHPRGRHARTPEPASSLLQFGTTEYVYGTRSIITFRISQLRLIRGVFSEPSVL